MKKNSKVYFQCDKCGKEIEYNITDDEYMYENSYWSINLGKPGYGSLFDGCDLKFDICDVCLNNFVDTFKYKNRIYNSGNNYYEENVEED